MLPKSDFDKLSIHQPLTESTVALRGYGGRELYTLGTCDLNCSHKDVDRDLQFHVVNEDGPAVLGLKLCVDMNLVKLVLSVDTHVQTGMTTDTELNKLITEISGHNPWDREIPRRTLIYAMSGRGTCRPPATQGTSGPLRQSEAGA